LKLGYIDYLNCYPFYYHMFERKKLEEVQIIPEYPNVLNSMMRKHELNMSPISAGAYPDISNTALLLGDFCLSSMGYVGSVNLVSKIPIEALDGKRIGITRASATSVVLLKILLGKFYNLSPQYIVTPPLPSMDNFDGALLIGNEAMMPSREPISFKYDLGELWLSKTGYPVVFAVFAIQKSAVKPFGEQIQRIITSYRESISCIKSEKQIVVQKAKERYPDIIYDIDFYFSLFQFDFTDNLKESLLYYYKLAEEMNLLKKTDKLAIL
jgi:chorismate dehydratase